MTDHAGLKVQQARILVVQSTRHSSRWGITTGFDGREVTVDVEGVCPSSSRRRILEGCGAGSARGLFLRVAEGGDSVDARWPRSSRGMALSVETGCAVWPSERRPDTGEVSAPAAAASMSS